MLVNIIKLEKKKNVYVIDFYLLLPKENIKNIKLVNNYYLQYCILLVRFIYFNKHNLITYN